MQLIIVSGLSGSGKSVALHTLEDEGFYCIDNLPTTLLVPLVEQLLKSGMPEYDRVAVGIDARSESDGLRNFAETVDQLRSFDDVELKIVFLHTELNTLLTRFSETRRRHPLSQRGIPLIEAIEVERGMLGAVSEQADLLLETTDLTLHDLRARLRERLLESSASSLSLLFQSFGFKNSVPVDTDYVFDVRCLPNPYWEKRLRLLKGDDPEVVEYLRANSEVEDMYGSIRDFLEQWLPCFQRENRSYMTVSIGCTGGQHRSVYLANRLCEHFRDRYDHVSVRHREL